MTVGSEWHARASEPQGGVSRRDAEHAGLRRARAEFTWAAAGRSCRIAGGGLNIAYEAVDRHAGGALADAVALRFLGKRGGTSELTYAQLKRETDRFANVLDALGVQRGERVVALAGRIPELYVAALGTLKHGSVFCPLFSAFGPEPIEQRLRLGDARVLVTTAGAVPPQGGGAARAAAAARARAAGRRADRSRADTRRRPTWTR